MEFLIVAVLGTLLGAGTTFALLEGIRRKTAADRAMARTDREQIQAFSRQISEDKIAARADRDVLEQDRVEVTSRKVSFDELRAENTLLRKELSLHGIHARKANLDNAALSQRQGVIDDKVNELAKRYLSDVEKWVAASINARNFATCKQRLVTVIEWCREVGFEVTAEREAQLIDTLKKDFEEEVRKAADREEQARIKAQIREEQAREREIQRTLQAAERDREIAAEALERAMANSPADRTEEIEQLKARLAEAEARNQRAIAQAQLTRAGHIYVVSNLGTFGDGVYKIGMTRRLEPIDRVTELSDASVPFPFDVHMMISCDDAPKLEHKLHQQFHKRRLNKVNPRKEFFRVSLEEVHAFVRDHHGEVTYVADAAAEEFRQSMTMSETDQEYIESVFDKSNPVRGEEEED